MKKISEYEPPKRMMIDVESLFDCDTCYHNQNGQCNTSCDAGESYRPAMSKLEIIEAEPVIHAHWIHETKENVWGNMQKIRKCSNCLQYGYKNKAFEFDFPNCPLCGAKMDGKEESE